MVTFATRNLLNLYLLLRSKLTVNTYLATFVVGFGTGDGRPGGVTTGGGGATAGSPPVVVESPGLRFPVDERR